MPKAVHNMVDKMKGKGMPEDKAWPIAQAANKKKGKVKKKGKSRMKMGKPYYGS